MIGFNFICLSLYKIVFEVSNHLRWLLFLIDFFIVYYTTFVVFLYQMLLNIVFKTNVLQKVNKIEGKYFMKLGKATPNTDILTI